MGHLAYVFMIFIKGMTLAFDVLSYNKVATQSHTYEYPGMRFDAKNAVDGNLTTCMRTRPVGTNALESITWWKVDLGRAYNIYSISILFKRYDSYEMRQKGRFAGFSLYISNNDVLSIDAIQGSRMCYKDGPQLPPLNFTTTCTEYGRYVIFYNERRTGTSYPEGYEVGNVFTELCEVSVEGCIKHGVYGKQCNSPCSMNCKDKMCHIVNGTCQTCEPGWIGQLCTIKCAVGRYGIECKGVCSGNCGDSNTCNHVTGGCDGACASGWTGYLCDKECKEGTYGYDCVHNCSGHCWNNSPCNKQTGHCDRGCNPGFTNVFCSEKCKPGYYGIGCGNLCHSYCMNNEVCNNIDGVCSAGCQDGYIGKYCNTSCTVGFFGRHCSSVCSPHCKTCQNTDGYCSCWAGYTGYRCTTACFQSYGENCRYSCSKHCYNKNCDRFNGSCLVGCTDGFYGERCEKDIQALSKNELFSNIWIAGFSICFAANIMFISIICVICRKKHTFISGNFSSCWKKSVPYSDTDMRMDETQTYQELSAPVPRTELPYDNTTLK